MRVAIIGPAPPLRGGIARHTLGLKEALERSGHRADVVSYTRLYPRWGFPGRTEKEQAVPVGVALLDTLDPRTWYRARRYLAAKGPDVVVVQWWHPVAAPALMTVTSGISARVIAVCHNPQPHETFVGARVLARQFLRRVDHVVCHSRSVAREVHALAPAVACGSSPMPLLIAPPETLRLTGCSNGPAALLLGCVRPYKGLDVLLEAWSRADLPSLSTLTVAGESYLGQGRLEELVAPLARRGVRIVNRYLKDDEVWSCLARARVLVLPYRSASQSGILPLGLLAGLRVIVSDAGGLAEPVEGNPMHDVVPAGDAEALARSLEKMLWAAAEAEESVDATRHASWHIRGLVAASWEPTVCLLERAAQRPV